MKKPDKKIIYTVLFVVAAVVAIWLYSAVKQTEVSVAVDEGIDVTPEVIESIEAIGQWEFLAIDDEERVSVHKVLTCHQDVEFLLQSRQTHLIA